MNFFWSDYQKTGDGIPKFHESTWEEFIDQKIYFRVTKGNSEQDKLSIGLWNPVKFKNNRRRLNDVESVCALVYDLDGKTDEFMSLLRAALKGLEYVLHSSFSHLFPGKGNCFRLILPLERPATQKEWKATREDFATLRGFPIGKDENGKDTGGDPKANNANTMFFWPSHSPDGAHEIERGHGRFVQVISSSTVVLKESKTTDGKGITGIPGHDGGFLRRWSVSTPGTEPKILYEKFKAGFPIAAIGNRDNELQKAMWCVANRMDGHQIHDTDEDIILLFMANSIRATPSPQEGDELTADHVREKLRRARRDVLSERTGQLLEKQKEEEFRESLFKNSISMELNIAVPTVLPVIATEPWNDNEEQEFSEKYFSGQFVKPLLLIREGKQFFVFTRKGFSPRLPNEYVGSYGVREGIINSGLNPVGIKRGETFVKTGKDILDGYPARTDIILTTQGSFVGHSRYDPETKIFTEVVNPMRRLEPYYDEEIAEFLALYCVKERDHAHLLAWLKRFPNLDLPNNVLFVYGPKNIGKSLISVALSRYWGRNSGIKPENFFETFQDAFVECPFIVADEGLPKGMVNSNEIRTFATTEEHNVNRKNLPTVTWKGCARMFISANNPDELKFSKDVLNQESIEAIESRFFRMEVSEQIKDFIAIRGGRAWTETLVAGDRFIRHVEWIHQYYQHRPLSEGERFPAQTDPADRMHDTMRLDQNLSEQACTLIWYCLKSPMAGPAADAWKNQHIFWYEIHGRRHLCVSSQIAQDATLWSVATEGQKVPVPDKRTLGRTLKLLASSHFKLEEGGRRIQEKRVWPIDLELFARWAVQSGYPESEIARLLKPTIESQVLYDA